MEIAGLVIAAIAGLAIAVIGVLYLVRPHEMATSFGLAVPTQVTVAPWLRVKGIRDLTSGIVAGVLLLVAPPAVIGWVLLAFALIPVGDAATVLTARGDARAAWGIHGATAAVMVVGAVLLLLSA